MPSKEAQTCAERSVLRTARPRTTDRDRSKIAFRSDATGRRSPSHRPSRTNAPTQINSGCAGERIIRITASHQSTPITRRSSACVT